MSDVDQHDHSAPAEGTVLAPRFITSDPSIGNERTLADAVDALGLGQKLRFRGETYDLSVIGALATGGKYVIGGGYHRGDADEGSILDGDGMAGPLVDNQIADTDENGRLADFAVKHTHGSSVAVVSDLIDAEIENVFVDLDSQGQGGFKVKGYSFFTTLERCFVRNVPGGGIGYEITGRGFAHRLIGCRQNAVNASDAVGLKVTALSGDDGPTNIRVVGGEFAGGKNTGGAALRWVNEAASNRGGGWVSTSVENADVAFDINADGSGITSKFNRVVLHRCKMLMGGVSTGVKFGDTNDSVLWLPDIPDPGEPGDWAEWTADSARCVAVVDQNTLNNGSYTVDASAFLPGIVCPQHLSDTQLANITTDSNMDIVVLRGTDQNAPVHHDGSDWYNMRTNATFTP